MYNVFHKWISQLQSKQFSTCIVNEKLNEILFPIGKVAKKFSKIVF